ncbi:MAG: CoA pyrophosphatase [Bacteroidales bacterium]|nr:CoA pyrophosphatase [Bacteroidales bacterium]
MDFHLLESLLNQRLAKPLPGVFAHERMVPPTRRETLNRPFPDRNVKFSAVLLLLYPNSGTLNFVLIKRARYDGVHSGQIALPGGQFETSDKNLKFTALRESQEEVGIEIQKVKIVGKLSEIYIPPSNFRVQPFVGFYSEKPVFRADGIETTGTIEVRIEDFLNPDLQTEKSVISRDGKNINVPCYYLNGEIVWGATAMILSEFFSVLKEITEDQFLKAH